MPSQPGGSSSTRVRVPGRVVRRGRSGSRVERELITPSSHRRAHRHRPLRSARALRRVLRCAARRGGRRRRPRSHGKPKAGASSKSVRVLSRRSPRAFRFARRSWPLRTGVLIATFHRAAPARRGAFVDERRVVAATEADLRRAARPWSRRSPRGFARLALERITSDRLIATFRCATCVALRASMGGAGCRRRAQARADAKRSSSPLGQCGLRSGVFSA
jgi:hypothetical protein